MSDKTTHVLTDKNVIPTEELIYSLIGINKIFWERIMKFANDGYNDITGNWNYYKDGKQWLFKLAHKKKTLLWASVFNDTFRITFWFGDKAEQSIEEALLPPAIKDEFRKAKKYGSVRPVSIIVREQSDADIVITLIALKYKIK